MKPDRQLKRKITKLLTLIRDDDRPDVEQRIAAVVNAGGKSEARLLAMSGDESVELQIRLDILWLLPRLQIGQAAEALIGLVNDRSERVREEAVLGLGLCSDEKSLEVLHQAVGSETNKFVRRAALHALGVRSSAKSAECLIDVLRNQDEDADLRSDAAEALGHVRSPCVVNALIHALIDDSPLVRYSATYALGEQRDVKALSVLNKLAVEDYAATQWGTVASSARAAINSIKEGTL